MYICYIVVVGDVVVVVAVVDADDLYDVTAIVAVCYLVCCYC